MSKKVLFVRCGERALPVGDENKILTLDTAMDAQKAHTSVNEVRAAVAELADGGNEVDLRVAGPGILYAFFAQALQHIPYTVQFVQLNQLTKQYGTWLSNRENI